MPVRLYGVGLLKSNPHARETGILSGEALADSVVVEEVTKIIFRRERPHFNNAAGDFFCTEHRCERLVSVVTQHAVLAIVALSVSLPLARKRAVRNALRAVSRVRRFALPTLRSWQNESSD